MDNIIAELGTEFKQHGVSRLAFPVRPKQDIEDLIHGLKPNKPRRSEVE